MSKLISLPHNIKTAYLYDDKEVDLSAWSPLVVNTGKCLTLETKDGKFKPKTIDEVLNIFSKYSCLFTYSPPGKDDAIFSLLTPDQLVYLNVFGKVTIGYTEIRKLKTMTKIGSTPIYNLIPQTKTYRGDSLEVCYQVANEVIKSREEFGLYNISSGASEARALMLQNDGIKDDILLSRRLKLDNIDKFNAACNGGRMESSGLGSSYQFHWDMIKAHLNILKNYPGLRDTTWSRGNNPRYFSKALPTSIYLIKTRIPKNKFKYNPLPVKTEAGTRFPPGEIIDWYYKGYLLLLQELKISFTILDSIQFVGKGTYPFKEYCSFLSGVMKLFESRYPDLEYKHLYATIAGNCKSIYKNIEEDLSQSNIASRVFNPVIYGYTLTEQNIELYRKALETDAEAIKVDSIATSRRIRIDEKYKLKGEGISTYLTPALKSVPGGKNLYKEAIKRYRNLEYVIIEMNAWNSLQNYLSDSLLGNTTDAELGERFRKVITIKPHYGNRKGAPIKRVGELLENWLISSPGKGTVGTDYNLLRVEDTIERFG